MTVDVVASACLRLFPHDTISDALDLSEAHADLHSALHLSIDDKAARLMYWKIPGQAMGAALKQQLESTFYRLLPASKCGISIQHCGFRSCSSCRR